MQKPQEAFKKVEKKSTILKTGAANTELYLPLLKGKNVAIIGNQTSIIATSAKNPKTKHLVDSLLSLGISVKKVFAPEHGFRGKADAGETIQDGFDTKSKNLMKRRDVFKIHIK